ncbi:hypothetical protein RUM44_004614 [Polyplax serrata]|uniref:Beta-1,4-glucuronyltransferase 1 n=1 Tax=Polyplax serrata TaxID=468196 RepID=A0ABR1B3E6_POLSC
MTLLEMYTKLAVRLNRETNTDSTSQYKILHLKKFGSVFKESDITLVSQCSFNHIHFIQKLSNIWKGPVSVSVFIEIENIEKIVWDLAKIINCMKNDNLQLYLVVPYQDVYIKNYTQRSNIAHNSVKPVSCYFSENSSTETNYNGTSPYPINLLRNVAKGGSLTDYILVIDIDMVPNLNLRTNFLNFSQKLKQSPNNEKSVFIVPVFESEGSANVPRNKTELIEQIKEKKCRPFYYLPCRNCQKATLYNKWLLSDQISGNVPNFDERFKQYGMNRVSQICELHVAGYRFYVLDNVFLVHRGFKTIGGFHGTKNEEMDANRKVYVQFKEELKFKYPNSKERC